jgi:hypothetical protein
LRSCLPGCGVACRVAELLAGLQSCLPGCGVACRVAELPAELPRGSLVELQSCLHRVAYGIAHGVASGQPHGVAELPRGSPAELRSCLRAALQSCRVAELSAELPRLSCGVALGQFCGVASGQPRGVADLRTCGAPGTNFPAPSLMPLP